MKQHRRRPPLIKIASVLLVVVIGFVISEDESTVSPRDNLPSNATEAAGRARWLHETIHGALQVMHRDFFGDGDDDSLSLPSQSLEDVFKEMARSWSVDIRWLGGNAVQDEEHEARDEFEKEAVKALIKGKPEYSKVEGNKFRFVGAITLHNQCLKCHVPQRQSMENRVAGLSITMSMKDAATVISKKRGE